MTLDLTTQTRPLGTISVPAPRPLDGRGPGRGLATPLAVPAPTHDVRLRPGNLVAVSDALGAQLFEVVDGEVTFTARSADRVRRWRGHLGAQGLVEL